jgi:class 3 adenylate cyclase/tetratricopeptide (TPR) repeat protein
VSEAERKQVTVLFADVSGSMELAEQSDPEQWRTIMQRFFAILAAAVAEFDGTVDKFTGDGIMAVFGAPVAQEDHAQRACYAALRMLDEVADYAAELRRDPGLNFSTRIGINSGEVVAGAIGAGEGGEWTAIGHPVGLAQRMEALAEPGSAFLTESTAALVDGYLDLSDLGEFTIKGASRPVKVHRLTGVGAARSRLDLARTRGLSEFVGREEEMAALAAGLERARGGDGAALGIVAEPGVGKSRLVREFAERCRAEGLEVFEAQAQAHAVRVPFMPILQMLRAYYGIDGGDSDQVVRERIAGRTLLLDPGLTEELPLLFDFLGVPDPERPAPTMSAEARQRALSALVCRLANTPARTMTLVLAVEDLHWIDEASEAMLAEMVEALAGTKALAVFNYRPEYAPPWAGSESFGELPLAPLERRDTARLLRHLAGEDASLDGLDEPLHERTGGNPFFLEEVVRDLAECGHLEGGPGAYRLALPIEDARVPVTVQAILAARIDRLPAEAKTLLQTAAVVGKEVEEPALALTAELDPAQMEPALEPLVAGGFLDRVELYPRRVLAFRHPLTREVAYGGLLADRRAATHAAAARATIALEGERLEELAGLVAHHMEEAGDNREAARWYSRAAHWAGHSQPREAMNLWRRVTDLADGLERDEEAVRLSLYSRILQLEYAWRLGIEPAALEELAGEARAIAEADDDLVSLTLLKLLTSARPGTTGSSSEWVRSAEGAAELAERSGEEGMRVAVRAAAAYAYMGAGDLDRVEAVAREMLELTEGDPDLGAGLVIASPRAWARTALGLARRERSDVDAAERLIDEAIAEAHGRGDLVVESWALGSKAEVLADRGETEAALALALRNRELTDRLGDVFSQTLTLTLLSYIRMEAGEWEAAIEDVERADREYRAAMGSGGETEAWRFTLRARALLGAGRVEEGLAQAEEAVEVARRREMYWQVPQALRMLAMGRAAAGLPGVDEALDEAAAEARTRGHTMALRQVEEARAELVSL